MTTTQITDELRLTMLKHLHGGKDLDQVAAITSQPRALVLDIVSKHGYPNSLDKGIDLLTAKIDGARRAEIPEARHLPTTTAPPQTSRPATTSPSSVTHPDARPAGGPDEIRVLINTAKAHPAKKIQNQANRVLDAIGRLRDLITEDEAKHAEKRRQAAKKAAARAEIDRLEKALADAKAKLRGPKPTQTTIAVDGSVSAAELREWARSKGIDVPTRGQLPAAIREQYAAEHGDNGEAA